jgi:EmrB/QacA subfamily drug resistance transporter
MEDGLSEQEERDTGPVPRVASVARIVDITDEPKPRRKIVFAVVALALFMSSVDQTIVATALPALQHDLHAPITWSGWTITIYALGQVLAMPLAGNISDQYGRKLVFLIAVGVFTGASICCGLAPNIYWLVPLRALQSLGGGAFLPAANGIVADMFGRERDRALGMFTSIFPIGAVAGPAMGGFFVEFWTWRGIFLVNVPIGLILILLGRRIIPRQPRTAGERFDLAGVALLGVTLIAVMVGITNLGSPGGDAARLGIVIVPILAGVGAAALFVLHIRRAPAPFVTPQLLFGRGFGIMNVTNVLFGSAALGLSALVPLYAQYRYGIGSLSSGSLLIARAIGVVSVASIAVLLLRKTGCRAPMIVGNLVIAAGLVTMAIPAPAGVAPYWWLCGSAALSGLGVGTAMPASNNAILQFAVDSIAAVSGLRGMFRQVGGILAVSISTAVVARSSHPGASLAYLFLGFAGLLLVSVPLAFLVPNHRGRI